MSKRRRSLGNSSSKKARECEPPMSERLEENRELATVEEPQRRASTSSSSVEQLANVMRDVFASLENNRPSTSSISRGDAIPYFDPEDSFQEINIWCNKIEELRDVFHWSEDAMIYHALSKLKGLAETWYRSLESVKYSWVEWKEKLNRAFPSTRDYAEKVEEMMKRRKGYSETYTRYYFEKLSLINSCGNISGQQAVSCIIHGLPDDHVKTSARAGSYASPEDLFTYLRTLTNNSSRPKDHKWDNKRVTKGVPYGRKDATNKTDGKCFKCGLVGHRAYQCKREREEVCGFCNKRGHDESRCYMKKNKTTTKESTM